MIYFIFLEGNMDGLGTFILAMLFVAFGVPLLLAFIGLMTWLNGKRKTPKILWVISVVYILISLGVCGSMM